MEFKHIPEGYHSITPYLVADNAAQLITFIEKAFAGKQVYEPMMMGTKIMHAEMQIGDSRVMIADSKEGYPAAPTVLYLYVEDVDSTYKQALDVGGKSISEPADMFYGDRHGGVLDTTGNKWWIATRKENLTPEQIKEREKEFIKNMAVGAKK